VNPLGANAWIWLSPLTDERLAELAPRVRAMGFDVLELPIERLGDWDPARAAEVLADHELAASVAVAMGPGRELCAADAGVVAETQAFLRSCVDAAADVGAGAIAGPIYASTGRVWRMSGEERARCYA
jgi:D-psicose/D-tagatose/L-ribulose 3-epimerase